MSGGEDKDDRQHEPSEQKLRKAREQGDVPRSAEATTALTYLGVFGAFAMGMAVVVPAWLGLAERLLGAETLPDGAESVARSLGLLSGGRCWAWHWFRPRWSWRGCWRSAGLWSRPRGWSPI